MPRPSRVVPIPFVTRLVPRLALLVALTGCSARDAGAASRRPSPRGCVTDVAPGAHTFTCEGLRTDLFVQHPEP